MLTDARESKSLYNKGLKMWCKIVQISHTTRAYQNPRWWKSSSERLMWQRKCTYEDVLKASVHKQ